MMKTIVILTLFFSCYCHFTTTNSEEYNSEENTIEALKPKRCFDKNGECRLKTLLGRQKFYFTANLKLLQKMADTVSGLTKDNINMSVIDFLALESLILDNFDEMNEQQRTYMQTEVDISKKELKSKLINLDSDKFFIN